MERKAELEQAIAASEREIEELEKKRLRSQSSLLEAFLDNAQPNEKDVQYFKTLSSLIDLEREKLRALNYELSQLN